MSELITGPSIAHNSLHLHTLSDLMRPREASALGRKRGNFRIFKTAVESGWRSVACRCFCAFPLLWLAGHFVVDLEVRLRERCNVEVLKLNEHMLPALVGRFIRSIDALILFLDYPNNSAAVFCALRVTNLVFERGCFVGCFWQRLVERFLQR